VHFLKAITQLKLLSAGGPGAGGGPHIFTEAIIWLTIHQAYQT